MPRNTGLPAPTSASKPNASATTGLPAPAEMRSRPIGALLGALGVPAPIALLDSEHGQLVALRLAWRQIASRWPSTAERAAVLAELTARADRLKRPAEPEQIAARVRALLAHYFRLDDPIDVQALVLSDWIAALDGAPLWAIEQACHAWLHDPDTARMKPLPADIRMRLPDLSGPEMPETRPRRLLLPEMSDRSPENVARLEAEIAANLAILRANARAQRAAQLDALLAVYPTGPTGAEAVAACLKRAGLLPESDTAAETTLPDCERERER